MLTPYKLEPKEWDNGEWVDLPLAYFDGEEFVDIGEIVVWEKQELILNKEIGAYATWYADPSNSVMLHYMTIDDEQVECLVRKRGDLEWQTIELFADKPFPRTNRRVRWFKLEGLEPNTTYETKLKYHEKVHMFKTMPNIFIRSLKFLTISDQLNSIPDFITDAQQGFQTMHNNNIDSILIVGDGAHDDGFRQDAWIAFWDEYFKSMNNNNLMIPITYALGNHDGRVLNPDGSYKTVLFYSGGATKDDVIFQYNFFSNLNDLAYGTVDISNYMTLIILNSFHTQPIIGTQTTWLENTLQERVGRHILPIFHVSPYPSYYDYNTSYMKQMRDYWTPLFAQYGVKVAANGHEHASMVTKKVIGDSINENGVVYTGQGFGMGNITRSTNKSDSWYVDYFSDKIKSFSVMEFKQDGNVILKHIGLDGSVLYNKTL